MSDDSRGWAEFFPRTEPQEPTTAPAIAAERDEPPAPVEPPASERTKQGDSQAAVAIQLAHSRYRIVNGGEGRVYAVERDRPSAAFEVNPSKFGELLAAEYFASKSKPLGGSALSDTLRTLRGQAHALEAETVYLRAAEVAGGIVLDLGRADFQVVHITAGSWRLVARSPVLFRRSPLARALPIPQQGGSLLPLRELLNVDESRFRLLVGWLVSTFMVDAPQVILTLTGQQGTAKSTAAELLLSLIDPSDGSLQGIPKDEENWAVVARSMRALALDNVSRMQPWFQDVLCKASTGGAFTRRARYSDDDVVAIRVKLPVIITTISPGEIQGDVADRMMLVELDPVPETERREAAEIDRQFAASYGSILGGLLDLVAGVLAVRDEVQLTSMTRMADFMRVLAALDEVTGWETLSDYRKAIETVSHDVIDGDDFASTIVELLERDGAWAGTCGQLLDVLTDIKTGGLGTAPASFPKSPKGVASKLSRLTPALRQSGVEVVAATERTHAGRIYRLRHLSEQATVAGATDAAPATCVVCGKPLHPSAIADGFTTHPSCESEGTR